MRLFKVCSQSAFVERVCKTEGFIDTEMRSRLSNATVQMLLYLYVNLRLLNKLKSGMGDFFTDAMRDSNSHKFKEKVNLITCISNEDLEESLDEIDETLTEKESSITTAFSWSNSSSQNRGGAAKRSKIDNSVVVIDSTPASPQ